MRAPRGLHYVTYGFLAAYVAVLLLAPDLLPPVVRDVVLGNIAFVGAICLLVERAASHPAERVWTLVLAVGATAYLVGNLA